MNETGIEYLEYTWNPIAMRCTPVSAGCDNCWHLRTADRHAVNPTLSEEMRGARAGGPPVLLEKEIEAPLRRRKPTGIGVQLMGDLFHETVHAEWAQLVVAIAAMAPQHQFLFLTKRPERAATVLGELGDLGTMHSMAMDEYGHHVFDVHARRRDDGRATAWCFEEYGLPPNVWLGVSVEDQATADERVPVLLEIPAAVRWVSCEPLLGPVDIYEWLGNWCSAYDDGIETRPGLSLAVTGAETGPGKRPMQLDWARGLRDQCRAANVPFFFKRDSQGNREIDGRLWEEMPDG
jgi:protein gp37